MHLPLIHPEIRVAQERYAAAKAALREALEEWDRLSVSERPRLTTAYAQHFGALEEELQTCALESAELFRRVELLSIKVSRGETLTPHIIELVNTVVGREFARFRRRLTEAFTSTPQERNAAALHRETVEDDEELVKLYRTLVKHMHPDSAGEGMPGTEQWHRMQNAYRNRNVSQLRSLLTMLGAGDANSEQTSEWDLDKWLEEAQRLEQRTAIEHRKLHRLRAQEPFTFGDNLDDEVWRESHAESLRRAIDQKKREIEENRAHYRELTGGELPPAEVKQANGETFEQDFMNNTYFGNR